MEINSNLHFTTDATRWHAVQTRNPKADTAFVYCVKTTGITCRPTCKARLARRSNVIFHNSYADAVADGFRACKRCRTEMKVYDPQKDVVAKACKSIAEAKGSAEGPGGANEERNGLSLEDLATKAGLTKSHFHRVFKKITGVTPRVYAINLRAEKLSEMSSPMSSESTPELYSVGSPMGDGDPQSPSVCLRNLPGADRVDELIMADFGTPNIELANEANASYYPLPGTVPSTTSQSIFIKDIVYTIQPWASGYVLIAATNDGICWLEADQSMEELAESLINQYPLADITINSWPGESTPSTTDHKHQMFSTVMEALINPTGKTLDVPFDFSVEAHST